MERLHAPNEFFRIRRLREGMRAWKYRDVALAESAIGAIGLEIESHLVDLDQRRLTGGSERLAGIRTEVDH